MYHKPFITHNFFQIAVIIFWWLASGFLCTFPVESTLEQMLVFFNWWLPLGISVTHGTSLEQAKLGQKEANGLNQLCSALRQFLHLLWGTEQLNLIYFILQLGKEISIEWSYEWSRNQGSHVFVMLIPRNRVHSQCLLISCSTFEDYHTIYFEKPRNVCTI